MAETGASLRIASDPALFREARAWLAAIASGAGFDSGEVHDVNLALSEACANAHRHAYAGRRDGVIEIDASWDLEALRIRVRDHGVRFDPEAWRPPDLDDPTEGGYGVFLIRNLMDDVRFRDEGSGMEVVMTKRLRRTGSGRAVAAGGGRR